MATTKLFNNYKIYPFAGEIIPSLWTVHGTPWQLFVVHVPTPSSMLALWDLLDSLNHVLSVIYHCTADQNITSLVISVILGTRKSFILY
jgi:hypothetical protein